MLTAQPRKASPKRPPVRARKAGAARPAKSATFHAKSARAIASRIVKDATKTKEKVKKPKLVRDSFTMPELEYAAFSEVKKASLKAGFEVKKSELMRVGLAMIQTLGLPALKRAINALVPLKPGRPRKEK